MPDSILDNPALAALNYGQDNLGHISELAAVYDPQVSPLAGIADTDPTAMSELARLVPSGAGIALLSVNDTLPESPAFHPIRQMQLHQMVCESPPSEVDTFDVLGAADVDDMIELAQLTEPGPFLPRTIEMGRYVGRRRDSQLVAMAGERMKPPGWIEISGVCTHPDGRGRGYAYRLVSNLLAECFAQDQRAFLHVIVGSPSERTAVGVYEKAGFRHRRHIHAHVLVRTEESP